MKNNEPLVQKKGKKALKTFGAKSIEPLLPLFLILLQLLIGIIKLNALKLRKNICLVSQF